MRFFLFAYNVSRNFVYHKARNDRVSGRNRSRVSTRKYSSVYSWLITFARYFEVDPDKPHFSLPFSKKTQVYAMYLLEVAAQNGELSFCLVEDN